MIVPMAALAGSASALSGRRAGWIYKPSWDLPFLILSSILVPLPFLAARSAQVSGWVREQQAIDLINIVVATLIGGPHLFSTVTFTLLDPRFRTRHPRYLAAALVLPLLVLYLGMTHYTALIAFFFTWASLHVLHQVIYLTDCYRERSGRRDAAWSRAVDYGLILTGLYPIGIAKIAEGRFGVGGVVLPYPDFLRPLPLPMVAAAVFAICLAAWVGKTTIEIRRGTLSVPKTLLIGITTLVSLLLPLGSNLDVLFQGYNTWHSFQYLFLLWLINRLRDQRGELEEGVVRRLVRREGMGAYYLCFLAATGVLVMVTLVVRAATSLSTDQSYFVVVLSVLLMHYYFDHFLFAHPRLVE